MVLKKLVKRIQGAPERWKNRLKIVKNTAEKVNNSDKNPINQIKNQEISSNIKKKNAKGRIQKKLIDAGHTKTSLRKAGDMNKDFQKMKKGKMTKAQFIKKYPKSQTAKRSKKSKFSSDWD